MKVVEPEPSSRPSFQSKVRDGMSFWSRLRQRTEFVRKLPQSIELITTRLDLLEIAAGIQPNELPEVLEVEIPVGEPVGCCLGSEDELYLAFENRFRSSASVATKAKRYLSMIEGFCGDRQEGVVVVDIGCGRGEFLDGVVASGFRGIGVETNLAEVRALRERGRVVFEGDANAYLRQCPDDSLGVVTAFHVVEHMNSAYFLEFISLLGRKIASEGMVILETPNPMCREVDYSFYHDLTHIRPYPRETMSFYLEAAGFTRLRAVYSSPCAPELRGLHPERDYLDYAIVASR